jgi:hypothetical protein
MPPVGGKGDEVACLPTFDVDDAQLLATFEPQPRPATGCYKKPFSHLFGHSQLKVWAE